MYIKNRNQLEIYDFISPFGGKLNPNNRWVILSKLVPWELFEDVYSESFSETSGAIAKSARMALGSLLIQEKLNCTDRELVEQVIENPYLQYFLGLKEYQDEAPFNSSTLVDFRKRISMEIIQSINEEVVKRSEEKQEISKKADIPISENDSSKENDSMDQSEKSHSGQLVIDASCAPSDITFPTDLKLLNHARELSEKIIRKLFYPLRKEERRPRTYNKKARKDYLSVAKKKRVSKEEYRSANEKQLQYLKRNLNHIEKLSTKSSLSLLAKGLYRKLLVISELVRQQQWMAETKTSIQDRIVSISQPHIRPIVRSKEKSSTEFGAKISISVANGFTFLDRLSWDNYNEGQDLIDQVESYKRRFGFYPESVHADQIYRSRANRAYCKEKKIRLSGSPLGRPISNQEKLKEQQLQVRQDERDRNIVEGKFGQAKRRFSLAKVMTKLPCTSSSKIALTFLMINLEKILLFCLFLGWRRRFFDFSAVFSSFQMKNIPLFYEFLLSIRMYNPKLILNKKNLLI